MDDWMYAEDYEPEKIFPVNAKMRVIFINATKDYAVVPRPSKHDPDFDYSDELWDIRHLENLDKEE